MLKLKVIFLDKRTSPKFLLSLSKNNVIRKRENPYSIRVAINVKTTEITVNIISILIVKRLDSSDNLSFVHLKFPTSSVNQ